MANVSGRRVIARGASTDVSSGMVRDLPKIRDALGVTTAGLASLLGVDARTVQRYLTLTREVPEPTWRLLNLAMAMPDARTRLEHMAGTRSG